MCGIAGIFHEPHRGPVSIEELRRMVAMLMHRGPDGYGLYRDDRVGLAHARLSIIDLPGGSQPMASEDGSVWVTFNGEIFNYLELRERLEGLGHRFSTQSDTEVIVHSFEEYGERAWEMFNGQFAFALWDSRTRRLWLVRDRFGILPLYYARASGRLLFASESKALFASGHVSPAFDSRGLFKVFSLWAVPAPSTVFCGVLSVPPGKAIGFDEELRERQRTYWQPDLHEDTGLARLSVDEAADALEEQMKQAVRLRLRADVPVGAYLSGGLDSSVIARLIHTADSSPLQTFAVRFEDPAFDETVQQRRMAALLGTEHHEILVGGKEIREALPEAIWHCETPLLRTAPVPLFLLSNLVNRNRMKVVLTGEGADELLAGYHVFREDRLRRFWANQPDSQKRPSLLSQLYPYVGEGKHQQTRMWQQFFRSGLAQVDHPFYSHRVRWQNTGWTTRFLAPHLLEGIDQDQVEAELGQRMPTGWREWKALGRAQLIEMATFLSPYLLCCQGDRVAMAHSVEVRYPFLDPEVVEFCNALGRRMKLRGLHDKVVLRLLASRHLPEDIWQRPKKPYRAPMTPVFFGEGNTDYVEEFLSHEALAKSGLVECTTADRLMEKARRQAGRMAGEREEMAVVGLLTLQLLRFFFVEQFSDRAAEARRRLHQYECTVFEDRVDHAGG